MKRARKKGRFLLFISILIFLTAVLSFPKWIMFFYPMPHQDLVFKYSHKHEVDALLVFSIIRAESKFQTEAKSPVGALGLMQIMPETGEWVAGQMGRKDFSADDLHEPETNIDIGCWYIDNLLKKYDNRVPLAVAAYNAGSGNVNKWLQDEVWDGSIDSLDNIPFPETRNYVRNVIRNYEAYRAIYN